MNKPIRIAALCLLACLLSTGCVSKKLYNELAARHAEAVAENEALAAENQKNLSEAGRYRSLYQEASDQLEAARRQSAADRSPRAAQTSICRLAAILPEDARK